MLNIILFITFSIPAVQMGVANIALNKIRPLIGTHVDLEGIRIKLFNTVQLKGLYVEDRQQDTLLYAGKIAVRINPWDLLNNKVMVHRVGIEDLKANVHRDSPTDPFNFQFIIDTFVKEKDSTIVEKEKKPWRITANEVEIKNGTFRYNILSFPETPGTFNVNHIALQGFNFEGKVDFLGLQDMQANVNQLRFTEKNAGIALHGLEATMKGKGTLLSSDGVTVDLNNSSIQVKGASYDLESKTFSITAQSNLIDPGDIHIFVPQFAHLDKPISFEVGAQGTLPQAEVKNLDFKYGYDTELILSASISDYSDINNGKLNVNLNKFSVSQEDLQALIRVGAPDFTSPEPLLAMGDLNLQMKAGGRLRQFTYEGAVMTGQGDVSLNGTGRIGNKFSSIELSGPVVANQIRVGNIIGDNVGIGNTTINTDITLTVIPNSSITVAANGQVVSTSFRNFNYNNIFFNGVYSGNNVVADIHSKTERNKFDLSGDITFGEMMKFIVKGDVERLDLTPFITNENWKDPYLRMNLDGNLAGSSLDDMIGNVVIDNVTLADSNFFYSPGSIYLQASVDEVEGKKIELSSSIIEGSITGNYYFSTIGEEMKQVLHAHLPSVILVNDGSQTHSGTNARQVQLQKSRSRDAVGETQQIPSKAGKNDFQFNFQIQNTEDISYAFSLPFYNVEPATISGHVNMMGDELFRVDTYLPRVMVGNNDIRESKVNLYDRITGLSLDLNSYLVQNTGFVNVKLDSDATLDSLSNRLSFDMQQNNSRSNGEFLINMGFIRDYENQLGADIRFLPAQVLFNNNAINFNDATITYRKDWIKISNFGIRENEMLLLGIDGVASKSEADNIRVFFNNTELANILNAVNVTSFAGSINGSIYIRQALDNPMIRTEQLRIDNITMQGDTIGDLRINADWDNLLSGLNINTWLDDKGDHIFEIKGFVPTGDNSPLPMDVNLKIADFKLKNLQPFTTDIFSELNGEINSNIHLTGTFSEPETEGWLGINEGTMRVAFTNVTYYVSDTIDISRDNVGLKNLVIRDQNNNTATLDLSLTHTNFGHMVYNAGIRLNDFLLLNNNSRTDLMAYGTLRLSGDMNVTGSSSGIVGNARLNNSSRSNVTVVLPQTATATEYSGVIFVSSRPQKTDSLAFLRKNEGQISQSNTNRSQGIPIVMNATVNLSPLLDLGVVLDPTTGNALEVNGSGELNINFNSRSTPPVRLFGDYVINSGNFKYNIQNLRTIDFNIREGSRLTMEGNPMNTQFNITAYRTVRADLTTLSPTFSTVLTNTRVPVNALLQIKGNLERMDLKFDVELPESSSDIQQRVNSFITSDEDRILQVVYLAAIGSFMSTGGTPDVNIGSSVTNLAAGALTRGLDALFAGVLNDNWSISTNLESVDGTFENVRLGVDLSTRLMNDRLRISTNLSYGDNSMLAGNQAFMGEFKLEYDLTRWLMLRAFNRANERFYRPAPFTQGVGVVVTREAKTLRSLFDLRFIRKRKEE